MHMASSKYDKGRLIDAPDATSKKLRELWIGIVAYIENSSIENAKRRKILVNEFGPGPYKFLNGDITLVPLWARGKAPHVALEDPDYDAEKVGPNSANFRVDFVESATARKGGKWRFMLAEPTDPQVRQILTSPLAPAGSVVLFTSLEKRRDKNNRSAYRNVTKPVPGELLELYAAGNPDAAPLRAEVLVERINQRYILVTF